MVERVILNASETRMIKKIIPDFQFGFRTEHSCKQQAPLSWIEKAFDRVLHEGLVYKFMNINFHI